MSSFLNAVGPWLVGLVMFGTPVLLAWWLSDGFSDIEIVPMQMSTFQPATGTTWIRPMEHEAFGSHYRHAYNHHTGHWDLVAVDRSTGMQRPI